MKTRLIELVREVGKEQELKRLSRDWSVIDKGDSGIATSVDLESEQKIVSFLTKEFPHISCWGEEQTRTISDDDIENNKFFWLIDPLDGTNNYVNGLPFYCISIALCKGDQVELGIVYNPVDQNYFFAELGKGAVYFNGINEVSLNSKFNKEVSKCLFSPGRLRAKRTPIGVEVDLLDKLSGNCRAIRRMGAAALEICLTAAGQLDGFWQFGLKPWDIAAGILIAGEAGLEVRDFKLEAATPFSKTILVLPNSLIGTLG